ncbi:phage repressor protein CI [Salmonella enterica subsp. enterica serovar Hadar str. ATCC 51956]|nr:phage repressor protein CI [Salmonella enterica subsp. enterica serovar Hadar str. ATCC 51956]
MKTFADRLNAAMSASGLSQAQLAEMVGISQPAIQKNVLWQNQWDKKDG